MAILQSKLTSQGQISVPAEIRRMLGLEPGSSLEWVAEDGRVAVRRAGTYSFKDIHLALFGGKTPAPKSDAELKEGIRKAVRKRYARG
ncbi:MAG: AbrB/MazE/SpoVT family DNA-binding domain-containing protein [Acidobacteria bacterium]|nr:AbrB/MazE/SpoVT family DNA-binding domain-containing protein [Acidobacteriota bacterium]